MKDCYYCSYIMTLLYYKGQERQRFQTKQIPDITKRNSWSDWSECDAQTGMRKRSKICDQAADCKPELEVVSQLMCLLSFVFSQRGECLSLQVQGRRSPYRRNLVCLLEETCRASERQICRSSMKNLSQFIFNFESLRNQKNWTKRIQRATL